MGRKARILYRIGKVFGIVALSIFAVMASVSVLAAFSDWSLPTEPYGINDFVKDMIVAPICVYFIIINAVSLIVIRCIGAQERKGAFSSIKAHVSMMVLGALGGNILYVLGARHALLNVCDAEGGENL